MKAQKRRRPDRNANSAVRADNAAFAYELRLQGFTVAKVAEKMEVTPAMVCYYVKQYMDKHVTPLAEEYRKMDLDRLDYLWNKLLPRLNTGDPQAITAAIRILDRRSKYLGLDAPTKVDATVVALDPNDIELRNLIERARIQAGIEESAIKGELVPEDEQDAV